MSEFLEAAMLICFGASWPINLAKNIRARSAKGMSLQFILLIIAGYVAGITAKFLTHRINYVLVVYFFNLIVVTCNLFVYFYNLKLDRARLEARTPAEEKEASDMIHAPQRERTQQELMFMEMNDVAPRGGIVFFGSDQFAALPVAELTRSFCIEENVCNRSVPGLTIDRIAPMLDVCVLDLKPRKVFVNLGDADLENPALDADDFISRYEWLLYTIHTRTRAKIYVVSLMPDTATARRLNARLKEMADSNGCDFIDVSDAAAAEHPDVRIFEILKTNLRSHPISFAEAMSAV